MKHKLIKAAAIIVVLAAITGLGFAGYTAYKNKMTATNGAPQAFGSNRILHELWLDYKAEMLEKDTLRTLDRSIGNVTTSEGQSYTMMRAVWMDDMDTFNKSWQWTKDNLQREDKLFAWKFGDKGNGEYGILTDENGQNTATDADVDIAFSLLMAAGRWKDYKYAADAQAIISNIWEKETVDINGERVLVANDIERRDRDSVIVNPSYFSPYAYRAFAKADPSNDWKQVIDSSYRILNASATQPLDSESASGLIPNWIRVDRESGSVIASDEYNSRYGYDALRTPWRMGLDYRWNNEPRAKQVLEKLSPLDESIRERGSLASEYNHDGSVFGDYQTPAMNGGSMAYFDIVHPEKADQFYTRNLLTYYSPDNMGWKEPLSYYDDNWVWFGMAFHTESLPNLTELIK